MGAGERARRCGRAKGAAPAARAAARRRAGSTATAARAAARRGAGTTAALLVGLALAGLAGPGSAAAKTVGQMGATEGVAVPGSPYRYLAISPTVPRPLTVVARVRRDGGGLSRYWYLPGRFQVPAVSFDPRNGGGLSADGGTLVLSGISRTFPPPVSRFAVLDTQRAHAWRGPGPPPRVRRFARVIGLRGDFSLAAVSPDGSAAYLFQRLAKYGPARYVADPVLWRLDLRSGHLDPRPILDRAAPRRVEGSPISQLSSRDGRRSYTLQEGSGRPYLSVLDTVSGRLRSVALPQLAHSSNPYLLRLEPQRDGSGLLVVRGVAVGNRGPMPVLAIDERGFEVVDLATSLAALARRALTMATAGLVRTDRAVRED